MLTDGQTDGQAYNYTLRRMAGATPQFPSVTRTKQSKTSRNLANSQITELYISDHDYKISSAGAPKIQT